MDLHLWPSARKFTSVESQAFWQGFDTVKPGSKERYWGWQDRPHRQVLVDAVAESPFNSVLEFGSNSGPNVANIARAHPDATVHGVDINEVAVAFGDQQLAEAGLVNAELRLSSLYDLSAIESDSYDVVIASAVLQHIPEDQIENVVREVGRIARSRVIVIDMHLFAPFGSAHHPPKPQRAAVFLKDRWPREWWALVERTIPHAAHVRIEELPPRANLNDVPDYNALITVKLG
jgi:hypothetical protein